MSQILLPAVLHLRLDRWSFGQNGPRRVLFSRSGYLLPFLCLGFSHYERAIGD